VQPRATNLRDVASTTIRSATLADLDIVVALRLALLNEAHDHPVYGRLRTDAAQRARRMFRSQLESPTEVTLLADRAGRPVGILRCVECQSSPLLEPERYAYVSSVYVIPRARRAGVLRALLAHASEWCATRGLDEMRLHSVTGTDATVVWDALGFVVVEQLRLRPIRGLR
jgi:GNAT superfamily N-acetyltransferase